jgi:hypothetical protein
MILGTFLLILFWSLIIGGFIYMIVCESQLPLPKGKGLLAKEDKKEKKKNEDY